MTAPTYAIKLVNTDEVLADNLTEAQVEDWWAHNENKYFGLRVDGTDIIVQRAEDDGDVYAPDA
jgi:hypothetical protein